MLAIFGPRGDMGSGRLEELGVSGDSASSSSFSASRRALRVGMSSVVGLGRRGVSVISSSSRRWPPALLS